MHANGLVPLPLEALEIISDKELLIERRYMWHFMPYFINSSLGPAYTIRGLHFESSHTML